VLPLAENIIAQVHSRLATEALEGIQEDAAQDTYVAALERAITPDDALEYYKGRVRALWVGRRYGPRSLDQPPVGDPDGRPMSDTVASHNYYYTRTNRGWRKEDLRKCRGCSYRFLPQHGNQRYCCQRCRNHAKAERRTKARVCLWHNGPVQGGPAAKAARLCDSCRSAYLEYHRHKAAGIRDRHRRNRQCSDCQQFSHTTVCVSCRTRRATAQRLRRARNPEMVRQYDRQRSRRHRQQLRLDAVLATLEELSRDPALPALKGRGLTAKVHTRIAQALRRVGAAG